MAYGWQPTCIYTNFPDSSGMTSMGLKGRKFVRTSKRVTLLTGTDNLAQGSAGEKDSLISVIICTYGRATALLDLLKALQNQTYHQLEVLVVDGNDEPSPARET